MDIPLNAEVQCADGRCGHSTHVIVDPLLKQVTHVVVKPDGLFADTDHLVPVDNIVQTTPDLILLRCTKQQMSDMPVFTEYQFIPPYGEQAGTLMWPYAEPLEPMPIGHERVPHGELTVQRGDRVEARDGDIGRVDELLVDRASGAITHLIMSQGHLWGKKDITIPVSQIDRISDGVVYLSLDKQGVQALPAVAIRRG
jgi:sporulation protein YlmC with PRC-barrel domain